jgi:hypothetical protein
MWMGDGLIGIGFTVINKLPSAGLTTALRPLSEVEMTAMSVWADATCDHKTAKAAVKIIFHGIVMPYCPLYRVIRIAIPSSDYKTIPLAIADKTSFSLLAGICVFMLKLYWHF